MSVLFLLLSSLAAAAAEPGITPASRERVVGTVQPEIRLENGVVFKNAKVLGVSLEKGTATISDTRRIRTVPLQQLPTPLREQAVAEAQRGDMPRYNVYRQEVRPPPPPDKVIARPTPAPPVTATPAGPNLMEKLLAQAAEEAPDELKLHLLRLNERVSSVTTKIRKVEQVPGWSKIRASGDATFSVWDNSRRDYLWRTEKFEVEFAIVNGTDLRLDTVTFAGISRQAEIEY